MRAVAALHRAAGTPLQIIHLGGDELARGAWTDSPLLTRWMQEEGLKDRDAVWDRFYDTVGRMAAKEHLRVAGWEEIAARRERAGGPLVANEALKPHAFQAFVWNNLEGAEDLGLRIANAGFPTVLAPVSAYYLDMVYNLNPEEPGATWAPPIALETSFLFDPADYARRMPGDGSGRATLSDTGAAHLRGLEATLWSETMREPASIDYLMLPRMLALAERAWAPEPAWRDAPTPANPAYALAWSQFMNQVGKVALPALDDAGLNAYRIAAPGLEVRDGHLLANHEFPEMVLRYSLDGRDPVADSPRYNGPLPLSANIRVAAFDRRGRRGWVALVQP
jgi:hexosaminidase